MFRILVVEDNPDLNRTVCDFLGRSGYAATGCPGAEAAYDAMYETVFDLIVTDVMMPGIDGFEFAATVRSLNENIPILFMTAREDFASRQRGYRVGADDYMVKPVDLDEMFLRIGALLRRAKIASSRRLTVGSFVMDADERTAYLSGEEISLTNREFSLLFKLLSYPRKTFTRTQLMDEFWSVDTTSGPRAVMKNYAALLQDETLPPEQRREYAEAIEGTAIRMAALVSNILKLNKLENQQIFPQVRCFDLGEQLAECLLQFETAWEERELECSLAEDIQVEADPEQEEIRRIREKYQPRETSKLERLRELDRSVTRKGTAAALTLGVLGLLILGTGMSLCLVWAMYLPGIPLGLAGMALAGMAYPVCQRINRRERERLAPEILRLTEELLQ